MNKNAPDKTFLKNFTAVFVMLMLSAVALLTANAQKTPKHENYIQVVEKILSIDSTKGDVKMRLEFLSHGNFAKEDGNLAKNIKFDTASSNGKQEIVFEKGKRMNPTEVLINMYDGEVTDYPFDRHKADPVFFFTVKTDKAEKPVEKPKTTEGVTTAETEEKVAQIEEETETGVPFTLDFTPSMVGYTFTESKSADSDDTFIDLEIGIAHSGMVKLFSSFIMLLV